MFLALIQYLKPSLVQRRLGGITPSSAWMLAIGVVKRFSYNFKGLRLDNIKQASASGLEYCRIDTT